MKKFVCGMRELAKVKGLCVASIVGAVLLAGGNSVMADAQSEAPAAPAPAQYPLEISQVYYRYIPEENFQRISEFFSGKENPGSRKIVRSNPEQRSGFYYILRVDKGWASLPEGSQLVVHYVPVEKIYPVTYKFDLDEGVRSWNGEIFFGLTGEEWTHGEGEPIAWKLQLVSAEGTVLAEKNSFLWSEPRKQ